jgi:DNA-binding NarL/FixJ family response regulator
MFDLPNDGAGARKRAIEPCPLSSREMDVLRRLAEGKVYKQIAHELSLSTSTVRTHLHNVYGKLGAVDRAQAVLTATEKGWL